MPIANWASDNEVPVIIHNQKRIKLFGFNGRLYPKSKYGQLNLKVKGS